MVEEVEKDRRDHREGVDHQDGVDLQKGAGHQDEVIH
jgi:hypothetical protein